MTGESVNHPTHYAGSVECIDAIESVLSTHSDAVYGFYTGQVLKYLWRWNRKNGTEDLDKAMWYLNRLKERVKNAGESC